MKTYEVTLTLACTYTITAPNEEMAKDQAFEWFSECEPNYEIKETKERED